MTSVGQRTRPYVVSLASSPHWRMAEYVSASTSASVSIAQPTASSICLVECGSLNILAMKKRANPS